jgi:hypothetical protein
LLTFVIMTTRLERLEAAFGQSGDQTNPFEGVENQEDVRTRLGHLGTHLNTLFTLSQRQNMHKFVRRGRLSNDSDGTVLPNLSMMQNRFVPVVHTLLTCIQDQLERCPEEIRDALGTDRGDPDDQNQIDVDHASTKRRFFSALQTTETIENYSRLIGHWLSFLSNLVTLGFNFESALGLKLPEGSNRNAIELLAENENVTPSDIANFAITLLSNHRSISQSYEAEPLVWFAIGQFLDKDGDWSHSETSHKTLSAIKFLCRGSILLQKLTNVSPDNEESAFLEARTLLTLNHKQRNAFASVNRLHKGICSFARPVPARVILRESD